MRRIMRNPRKLKVRHYDACMIETNGYLDALPVSKASDKIEETILNKIILNSMPNIGVNKCTCRVLIVNVLLKKTRTHGNCGDYL